MTIDHWCFAPMDNLAFGKIVICLGMGILLLSEGVNSVRPCGPYYHWCFAPMIHLTFGEMV